MDDAHRSTFGIGPFLVLDEITVDVFNNDASDNNILMRFGNHDVCLLPVPSVRGCSVAVVHEQQNSH